MVMRFFSANYEYKNQTKMQSGTGGLTIIGKFKLFNGNHPVARGRV